MIVFLVSLLGFIFGALSTEEACLYKAEQDCNYYSIIPREFPRNEEEFKNACTHLNQTKQCIDESARNCSAEDVDYFTENDYIRLRRQLKDAQRMIDVTTEICQEDSELHANFVPDIPCYSEIFNTNDKKQYCRDYSDNAFNHIRTHLNTKLQGRDSENFLYSYCLHVLFDMNCFLEKFTEMCSSLAKDTTIELIEKAGSLDDQCPVSIRIDILELLDSLKLVTGKEVLVKQLLETNSFF
ncbi:uncharacterized protein LOC129984059 [Argiope bruennichi]|uniref:uncharacterized protein LOC129984059 n=1 Tax=Argiope bruennichi TaxID=94029 RepID=UPI002494B08F|nr:uncharacterized protein LOC129984059 [Argiope bruennichi]